MSLHKIRFVSLFLASLLITSHVVAQEMDPVLKKIKSTGAVVIGHRESSLPFSYTNPEHKPIGYSLDLCAHIVDAIKKTLSMPDIKVNYVSLSSSDRISKVADGSVDMECGSTSNLKERQKIIKFSNSIFFVDTKILVKSNSGIKSIDDLKGKRVVLNQGAQGALHLTKLDAQKHLGIQYIKSHDNDDSFKALASGKVDAFVHDDVQLAILAANSADASGYAMLDVSLARDPIGITMRNDSEQLEKIVNTELANLYKTGELNKIYAKWFVTPKLKFPMSDALKAAMNNPNNAAIN